MLNPEAQKVYDAAIAAAAREYKDAKEAALALFDKANQAAEKALKEAQERSE